MQTQLQTAMQPTKNGDNNKRHATSNKKHYNKQEATRLDPLAETASLPTTTPSTSPWLDLLFCIAWISLVSHRDDRGEPWFLRVETHDPTGHPKKSLLTRRIIMALSPRKSLWTNQRIKYITKSVFSLWVHFFKPARLFPCKFHVNCPCDIVISISVNQQANYPYSGTKCSAYVILKTLHVRFKACSQGQRSMKPTN